MYGCDESQGGLGNPSDRGQQMTLKDKRIPWTYSLVTRSMTNYTLRLWIIYHRYMERSTMCGYVNTWLYYRVK